MLTRAKPMAVNKQSQFALVPVCEENALRRHYERAAVRNKPNFLADPGGGVLYEQSQSAGGAQQWARGEESAPSVSSGQSCETKPISMGPLGRVSAGTVKNYEGSDITRHGKKQSQFRGLVQFRVSQGSGQGQDGPATGIPNARHRV